MTYLNNAFKYRFLESSSLLTQPGDVRTLAVYEFPPHSHLADLSSRTRLKLLCRICLDRSRRRSRPSNTRRPAKGGPGWNESVGELLHWRDKLLLLRCLIPKTAFCKPIKKFVVWGCKCVSCIMRCVWRGGCGGRKPAKQKENGRFCINWCGGSVLYDLGQSMKCYACRDKFSTLLKGTGRMPFMDRVI